MKAVKQRNRCCKPLSYTVRNFPKWGLTSMGVNFKTGTNQTNSDAFCEAFQYFQAK